MEICELFPEEQEVLEQAIQMSVTLLFMWTHLSEDSSHMTCSQCSVRKRKNTSYVTMEIISEFKYLPK